MTPLRTLALAPIFVPQALWVAARASRLPEAAGDRAGKCGNGPPLRLLILGDSSAAGVGVAQQSEALGGQLSTALARDNTVHWTVLARSGGTVRSTLHLLETLPDERIDAVLVALGVNDAKNGVAYSQWGIRYRSLLTTLEDRFEGPRICVSGLPPLRRFPILPEPLNTVLGARAERFDEGLRQIAQDRADTIHLPMDFTLDERAMASDGFHPGPDIYAEWAQRAAEVFRNR